MRKILVLLLIAPGFCLTASSQYWQQKANYTIDVTLNDKENSLDAFEKIEYYNNSPDTLKFIWFHLWSNAYKNDKTAFTDQTLLNGDTRFYFSNKEERGYINRLDFKANNITCNTEDHPRYIDIVKVILPTPLAPGQKTLITTPFHVQLPFNFSRGGHDGETYQVTQWFPKPAVFDKNGWHPMAYLEQGEYYSEFGTFDVRITVPKNYVVAATGELQSDDDGEAEKNWLLSRSKFSWQPTKQKTKTKGVVKTTILKFPPSSRETKTLRYVQANIHDFAWFADKRFIVEHDSCEVAPGRTIDVYVYYTPQERIMWRNSLVYAKRAVQFYSAQVAAYPYASVSVVQGPQSFGGGMEYPMITVISPSSTPKDLDITIAHEIGHNWFYGVIASNERDHPWMDEGVNTFYEYRYARKYYNSAPSAQERVLFETLAEERLDQPIETKSEKFNEPNYDLVAYYKTSEWLRWIEHQVGTMALDSAMKYYYNEWQFKHPQPEDFRAAIEHSTGRNLDSAFTYLNKSGALPFRQRKGTIFSSLLQPEHLGSDSWFQEVHSKKNIITIGPSLGGNAYDKFMLGALVTNYNLPLNRLKFLAIPMFAFGSKSFTGVGKLDFTFYPNKAFRKIDVFVNGSTFTENEYIDTAGKKTELGFQKIVPGIRFTFKQKDPLSHLHRYIQLKSFFLVEDGLKFSRDTLINPPAIVTNVAKTKDSWNLNQLLMVVENVRALYPYKGELRLEQTKDFVRAAFTGNYFFNYPRSGGLHVRFFAGKFFYTVSKTVSEQFATERYHLNLSGPNGYEDYTFSDYFLGRNKFEGFASQQLMMRDGGFKVKTDLLSDPVGQTDNWLLSANFTSTLPSSINPLSLLPLKIPLKVFLDVGTYAEAWNKNSEVDHFLFDGGLQLSILKNTINIYLPLIYSDVYKSYIQSILEKKNRFLKKISFSIDISSFTLKKIDKSLSF